MMKHYAPLLDTNEARQYSFIGYICVSPNGVPFWDSAMPTVAESVGRCFGYRSVWELHRLGDEGWRCVPIGATAPRTEARRAETRSGSACEGLIGESRGAHE